VKSVNVVSALESDPKPYEVPDRSGPGFRRVASFRFFRCQQLMYLWSDEEMTFKRLHGLDNDVPLDAFHRAKALSKEAQSVR
jgi:hypothetical protein